MSFDREAHVEVVARTAPDWMTGGGPTEIVAQYGNGGFFTAVFTVHTATSDERITMVHTSLVVDGRATDDRLAYDPRIAYKQVDGLQARLGEAIGPRPGVTYGLP